MWILKNAKELLDHLKSPKFNLITNIKSFDFSTLYTIIPHQKLKSRLATIKRNSFIHKNGNRRYKYSLQSLLSTSRKRLASQFNFTYRYIDDVLSINNPDFENYLGQMYPPELDQRHDGEQHICFLLGFTPVNR